ncbi:hypothetical protein NSK_000441 [Nannochloropsis salina CCMP1776]|jgi:nucleoside-diphosphate-sugar epimerase|uniref:NAD-dependent epimerase/dehydratase domain-containing protein n=1 Tax=Nannochloropsis salina CCMP1776 TaxID=1027361 RepID=A0A4D9DCF5_9STRA|nr:hypothetical protein NSK_000441 [Nannochloropsis salina CCMP1776]|eukprot:TFJ88087.1 hypothetical protein NSK_000441 [Nannochloropsis salina CCMP1776]
MQLFLLAISILGLASSSSSPKKELLVLGGNGFMGVYTVIALAFSDRYAVTIANRNTTYFDSLERLASANITSLHWDRRSEPIEDASEVVAFFEDHPRIHAIVDFSCYSGDSARNVATFLIKEKVRVGLYVYVSSDSIYEVCSAKRDPEKPTTEDVDDHRPSGPRSQAKFNAADTYGHGKLEAEEVLRELQPVSTWDYIFLRIPDVVGPRDTSYRWWFYQILIDLQIWIHVPLPYVREDRDGREMSLVYVKDVARVIVSLISGHDGAFVHRRGANMSDRALIVKNVAINVADHRARTFVQIMEDIAKTLATSRSSQWPTSSSSTMPSPLVFALNATTDFPSVKRGPISTTRARTLLGWEPTPWDEVVRETVEFFQSRILWKDARYAKELQGVLQMVCQQVAKYIDERTFRDLLQKMYGLNASEMTLTCAGCASDVIVEDEPWSSQIEL